MGSLTDGAGPGGSIAWGSGEDTASDGTSFPARAEVDTSTADSAQEDDKQNSKSETNCHSSIHSICVTARQKDISMCVTKKNTCKFFHGYYTIIKTAHIWT